MWKNNHERLIISVEISSRIYILAAPMKSLRFAFILLISILTVNNTLAQTLREKLDSNFKLLQNTSDDSVRVFLLCDISADYFNIEPDSGIYYGKQALKIAEEHKIMRGVAIANKAIARCYAIKCLYPEALEYFNTALIEAKNINNNSITAAVLVSIGSVYTEKYEYDKALGYYLEAKDLFTETGESTAVVARSIGILYGKQNKKEDAIAAFREGIQQELKKEQPTMLLAQLYGSTGSSYSDMDMYSQAFTYLFKSLYTLEQLGIEHSMAYTYNNIGSTYLFAATRTGVQLPDSLRNKDAVLQKALKYLKRSAAISEKMDLTKLQEALYKNISDVYYEMGDYNNSLRYYKQTIAIGDSLRDFDEEKRFAKVEAEFLMKQKTDSLKYFNKLKDGQIEKRKTERNAIIAILALVGCSALLFINRQNIQRKKLQAEKELADTRLTTAQKRLNGFTQSLREKNQLIEDFTAEVERLHALPCSNELPETKANLAKLQNSIILTEEQWEDFRDTFEEVHAGFLMRLKEKIPGLTPGETRFMALSKLGFSNKEMSRMQGIGLSGMRNYKHRMRVKLNISTDSELDEILAGI